MGWRRRRVGAAAAGRIRDEMTLEKIHRLRRGGIDRRRPTAPRRPRRRARRIAVAHQHLDRRAAGDAGRRKRRERGELDDEVVDGGLDRLGIVSRARQLGAIERARRHRRSRRREHRRHRQDDRRLDDVTPRSLDRVHPHGCTSTTRSSSPAVSPFAA